MKVLVALDESPVSVRAARIAASLFGRDASAEFLVINVARVPAPWVGTARFGAVAPLYVDPRWLESAEATDPPERAQLMATAREAGVPDPEPVLRSGDPVTEICAAADEHDVDVITVGSHDKTALRRLFDPSVAAGVVRDTYKPVLVVSGTPPSDV